MKKTSKTEENCDSHVVSNMAAAGIISVSLAIFPPFALIGLLALICRKSAVKEVGESMDSEEMSDTEKIANEYGKNTQKGERQISITRTRESDGFIPMWVDRTYTYSVDSKDK